MGWERIELTRLRVDEVHSSGHFIDEFILAALVRRLEKHPFESHFFTKCEQQPGPIHLVAKVRHESALMLGDRRYRIATDSAPTSKISHLIVSHYLQQATHHQ